MAGAARNLEDPPLPQAGGGDLVGARNLSPLSFYLREIQRVDFELSQLRHNLLGK